MTAAPVYTAIALARAALSAALGPNAHWQRVEGEQSRPYMVFDSQDAGGKQNKTVGSSAWQGLITVRAIADYQDEADAVIEAIKTPMQALTTAAGYSIASVFIRPITIPPTAEVRYAAAQWEIFIERT
jgi:hypothetical protein